MFKGRVLKKALMLLAMSFTCSSGLAVADDCQIQISQAVIDYGDLNPSLLRASAKSLPTASLGKRFMQLSILCTEAKDMAVTFRGLAAGLQSYQISDKGEFDLTLKDARLDGEPVRLGLVSRAGEVPGENGPSVKLIPGHYVVPVKNQAVQIGKVWSMKVELDTRLFVEGLRLRDLTTLEGQGQFELN